VTPANARDAATEILVQVLAFGRSLSACVAPVLEGIADPRERALAQELCFGVARWHPRLDAIAKQLVAKPLRRRDSDVQALILLGLYQLLYTRIPAHAAVAETVAVAGSRGKSWARPLINGVLRRFLREQQGLVARVDAEPEALYAHPTWLITALREGWPGHWEAILRANNQRPPMSLRVNARRIGRDDYRHILTAAGIEARPIAHTSHGLTLSAAHDVAQLPGFEAGLVSVQDGAAQLAPGLLALAPGLRVLDACAAPGGKATHMLECEAALARVVCVERDASRIGLLEANLARLGLQAEVVCADAGAPATWWDGEPFDRILVDAPCSATGVVRRHPDIKLHRRARDVPALVTQQARMLDALWPLLAPRGLLLYASCSVLPPENQRQVKRLVESRAEVTVAEPDVAWGHPCAPGRQILPGEDEMDGFYYALLRRG
jgi:16S rRNA (cytosine967-C5)-methyltransferase